MLILATIARIPNIPDFSIPTASVCPGWLDKDRNKNKKLVKVNKAQGRVKGDNYPSQILKKLTTFLDA